MLAWSTVPSIVASSKNGLWLITVFHINDTTIPLIMTHAKYILRSFVVVTSLISATSLLAAELRVRIEGIAEKGSIHVYVFTAPEGFPKEEHAAIHQVYSRPAPAQNDLDIQISVPDSAEYAVMSFQDKDGNGKMNRLLGMIPQEPYGLSRNPQLFGKPKFSDAAIKTSDSKFIVLKLHD